MAPPGRRRLWQLLLPILLLVDVIYAQSAVLGIDLGTEYIKATLVKPGTPLEIVLAKDSKRKDPSILALKPLKQGQIPHPETSYPERSYGSAGQALAARFPGDTYPNLKQLLGIPIESSSMAALYKERYPALNLKAMDPRRTGAFSSPSFPDTEVPFAIEELLAMQLKNTLENAQEMAGPNFKVNTAVFTIPPFYTIEEKAALELAADLAKISILGTVTDGLAVGIHYATSRNFPDVTDPAKGNKPELHMVFDVGAGYTTATVLKMQSRSVKDVGKFNKTVQEVIVLGNGWDRTLGGDAMNQLIVEDIATKFIESPKGSKLGKTAKDVLSHGRATARMWKDAEKLRQVLSANQATGASFEELYEDVDFKYKLNRADFEALTKGFADRLEGPFVNALKMANINAADLDSVILHGGAIRTPFIQRKLEELAGDASKLRSNVNSDEAAVFGAAFKAAQLSPSFRVKDIRASDAVNYPTWMQYRKEENGKQTQQKIFTSNSFFGSTKVFTLPKLEDFEIYIYQNRPTDRGSPFDNGNTGITGSKYQSVNLTQSVNQLVTDFNCKKEDIVTQVTVRLSPGFGLPGVTGGKVSCEYEVVESKGGVMDGVKDFLGFGKKEDGDQKVLKDDDSSSSSKSSKSGKAGKSASSSSASASASNEPAKPTKKTKSIAFEFDATHDEGTAISYVEQKFIAERIRSFDKSDEKRLLRDQDHNNLEGFIYRIRDWLEDTSFTTFASKPMIKEMEKLVASTSTWLSEVDVVAATSEILKTKLKGLTDLTDPVIFRKEESAKRPELVSALNEALNQAKSLITMVEESIEQGKSAAEAAKSSSTESTESEETPAPSASDADDLEEPDTTTSTSSVVSPTPEAPFVSPYTEEDLKSMKSSYEKVKEWLDNAIAEQDKLGPFEEPALISKDLEKKAKSLSDALMKLLQQKFQKPADDKAKGKSKSKSKSKSSKSKSKSSKSASASTESSKAEETPAGHTRDEL